MKKSIFLFFAAILCAMSVDAKTVYLKAGLWDVDGAKFGCHTWGSGSDKSGFMTHVEGDIYSFETLDAQTDVIFTRVSPSSTNIWGDGGKEWNRVETKFQSGKDMFVITDWGAGKWDVYAPAVTHTFAKNSTIYLDFRALTKKGADIPQAGTAATTYNGEAGGNVIPLTFTADVKWAEGSQFFKTNQGDWAVIPFHAPTSGANCAQVAADGKSYTWTTYSEPSVTLSLDKTEADAGTEVTVTLTATAGNVSGEVTYAFQYSTDNATWNDITATDNTATQTFAAETRYYKVTMTNGGTTKEATAKFSAIKFHVIGSWDSWGTHNEVVEGSKIITLEANKTYEYKITNGTWDLSWGYSGMMERSNCTDWTFETTYGNAQIKTDVAGDYVFNVSRNAEGKVNVSVTYPEQTETPEPVDHTYTVAGTEVPFGTNWNAADTNNDMVNNGDGTYTWKRDNLEFKETKEVQFKVCEDHNWDVAYPASNYVLNIEKGYYTITITYTPADNNKVEATAEKTGEYNGDAPTHTYTIAGSAALCGVEWDYAATANDMTTADNVSYTWSKTGVEVKGNLEFKVFEDHSNSTAYPSNNSVIDPTDYEGAAVYTVTITFNAETKEITVAMEKTGDVTPVVYTYYLMGVNADWTNGIALTQNPGNADEYVLENQVIIKATDAVKVVTLTDGTASAWCGNVDTWSNATYTADGDGNIVLEDGIYTFYFKKNDNLIYINQTGYARNVTNKYGTICLPYAAESTTGAIFYRVAGKETGKVYLESVDALEAGVPYIFEKSASQIKVVYTGEKETTAGSANGLVGTFADNTPVPDDAYILYGGAFCTNNDPTKPNKINAYRAYLDLSAVDGGKPQPMPGRRYIGMSVQGENEATGLDNNQLPITNIQKAIENGQLIIIRDGVKYNVQGQKL